MPGQKHPRERVAECRRVIAAEAINARSVANAIAAWQDKGPLAQQRVELHTKQADALDSIVVAMDRAMEHLQ